jgi:hypothetical protein
LWFTAPKGSEPAAGATRLHLVPVVVAAGGACILTGAF